ncbi:MAG: aspartate/glutamate racemase family protein [Roseicyclus sp.]|jgi:Asp/Glu/hydantoin racemase
MRLLIVNPNTSAGVTARIDAAAQSVAQPGDHFVTISAAFGPPLIVDKNDAEQATEGVLKAIADYDETVDGIVLASFGDTGAARVRAAYPHLPVVGIAEAAFREVRRIGGPFAIVTFAAEVAGPLVEKAAEHGAAAELIRVASPPGPLLHAAADVADKMCAELRDLCLECASEGAQSIVLGGGPLAGLAGRVSSECPVAIVDGTQAAIAQLRASLP